MKNSNEDKQSCVIWVTPNIEVLSITENTQGTPGNDTQDDDYENQPWS